MHRNCNPLKGCVDKQIKPQAVNVRIHQKKRIINATAAGKLLSSCMLTCVCIVTYGLLFAYEDDEGEDPVEAVEGRGERLQCIGR